MKSVIELEKLVKDIKHGDSTLLEHSIEVYNVLKEIGLEDYVCEAGLFHSIYSTEYYSHGTKISRQDLEKIIGSKSENLVHLFCTINDRDFSILNNTNNLDKDTHYNLLCLSYANLLTQKHRPGATEMLDKFAIKIEELENQHIEHINFCVDNKNIFVIDNKLEHYYLDKLFNFCRQSQYIPDHGSTELKIKNDSRFVSYLNEQDLELIEYKKIINAISPIKIGEIKSAYINVYNIGSFNNPHTDESSEEYVTVLVYPNTEWNTLWGGETKFYSQKEIQNYVVDYVPGRIVVFDSRIQHHSLTVNYSAEIARYSIVLKCKKYE